MAAPARRGTPAAIESGVGREASDKTRAILCSPWDLDQASWKCRDGPDKGGEGFFPEEGRRNPDGEGALAGDAANEE